MTTHRKPVEANPPGATSMELFGMSRGFTITLAVLSGAMILFGLYWCIHSAPPHVVTISSGPPDSQFDKNAQKYAAILKREGITLVIVPSEGSSENLKRLADPSSRVDVGFVQSGESTGTVTENLVSLGSLYNEPLLVFYRGLKPVELLSQFKGQRIAVGPTGSGTQALTLALLADNDIKPGGPTQLLELDADDAAKALLDGKIEAAFMMGDSASSKILHELLHQPGVHLVNFVQADAYTRHITYLNEMKLPRGAIDYGKDIPREDVNLLGPTVELIGRNTLHPALSDMLLEAAHEVHSGPGLFRRAGEFPAPMEHDIRLSVDALRYYKSGKSFFYRYLPFTIARLVDRVVVVIVPLILVLVPMVKFVISAYRWRITFSINRWYRALLIIEQEVIAGTTAERRKELVSKLDQIETRVNRMKVPASFAGQFYELRGHVSFVRGQIEK